MHNRFVCFFSPHLMEGYQLGKWECESYSLTSAYNQRGKGGFNPLKPNVLTPPQITWLMGKYSNMIPCPHDLQSSLWKTPWGRPLDPTPIGKALRSSSTCGFIGSMWFVHPTPTCLPSSEQALVSVHSQFRKSSTFMWCMKLKKKNVFDGKNWCFSNSGGKPLK